MSYNYTELHKMLRMGDPLSTPELNALKDKYEQMRDALEGTGDLFYLPCLEINRTLSRVNDFLNARSRK